MLLVCFFVDIDNECYVDDDVNVEGIFYDRSNEKYSTSHACREYSIIRI